MIPLQEETVARARPSTPDPEPATVSIQVRVEPELKDRIRAAAESLGLNVSAFLRMIAIERMDRMDAERDE